MSTEDLHTSSDPTQSGKVVQLNGDCTSQITLPMSHTVACGEELGQLRVNTTNINSLKHLTIILRKCTKL